MNHPALKGLDKDVKRRIIEASNSIRKKFLTLKREREEDLEEEEEDLKNTRTEQPNAETIKLIDKHSRNVKGLYDNLKQNRFESARQLESTYRPLAKIISSTIEKNTSRTLPLKEEITTPFTKKRSGSEQKFSPTIVKKRRYPLNFNSTEQQVDNDNVNDQESIPDEPAATHHDVEMENPANSTSINQSLFNNIIDEDDLNQTLYEHNPRESYYYDDDFRLESNLPPVNTDYVSEASFNDFLDQYDELPREFVKGLIKDTKHEYDQGYLKYEPETDRVYFGDSRLDFKGPDIEVKGETFKGTPGLYELLFKTAPIRNKITALDERQFAKIVFLTNAHKRHFKATEQIQGNKGLKYILTIKPILEKNRDDSDKNQKVFDKELGIVRRTHQKGYGFNDNNDMKLLELPDKIDFVYWDDPNELVDRLRILIASTEVGNNNNGNEILSIIDELREADIIE